MKIKMKNVKVECTCAECEHSEKVYRDNDNILYCYFWDYEQGMSPNTVDANDFCSNAEKRKK